MFVIDGHLDQNKAFLVPDSGKQQIVRNDNSISLFLIFSDNLALVVDFLTLQNKQNTCTLLVKIKCICTCCETG